MIRILVTVRNRKTCTTWAKQVHGVDLSREGGWALQGTFLSGVPGRFQVADISGAGDLYEDDTLAPGDFVVVGYKGGSHKNKEQWAALVEVTEPGDTDSVAGVAYDAAGIEGGRVVFFASSHAPQRAVEALRSMGVVFDNALRARAKNPFYACALAYHALMENAEKAPASLPTLPDGWEWGPEVSGIRFLRRQGHAELVFPVQPFLPADFLRAQAERLRALAAVAETAAEMAEKAEEVDGAQGAREEGRDAVA